MNEIAMVPAAPAEQSVIRDSAIALLVEKLREIGSQAHAQYASEARRLANIGNMGSQEWLNRRENALTQYALSDRCEQLSEAITGALLFDQLDADLPAEAFIEAADAERYAQREDYVNADVHVPCTCHTDPDACRAFGRGEELDATDDGRELDDVYAEGEREAEDARLAEENEAEYFGAADAERWAEENAANQYGVEHFDAAEAADVLQIEHEMAIEAGMECDPETCAYCGGA